MDQDARTEARTTSGQSAATEDARGEVCDLRVEGMDCPSCADEIRRALAPLEGIQDVRVDVLGGRVRVDYAPGKLARGDLAGAIRRIGYQVREGEVRQASFTVAEMDCADEVRQIEDKLGRLPGVTNLRFDLLSRRLTVEGSITAAEIRLALQELGMTARTEGEQARPLTFWQRRGRLTMAIASGVLLAAGLALQAARLSDVLTIPLLALSALAGGWFVAPRAWRAVRSGTLDMNFLMTAAAAGAAVIGEWSEGASVLFLFSIAQILEAYSMDRARNAIRALMDLSPTEATVRRDGREDTIPAAEVAVGETLVVRPGQRIPLDGEVVAGHSAVDQAPITGESLPVEKQPGDNVFAGSINAHGLLEILVTKLIQDTTLARIIYAVEEAQASRAPSQSFVDRFSRIYTPAVVASAALVFLVPPLVGLGGWGTWFYRALALLVIACPCALVISTPVSVVSGLAGAARRGVLIKGGLHLENAGRVTTVAFDKTGTLTEGRPVVTDVLPLAAIDRREVLRLAAALEKGSEHPLARAILNEAEEEEIELPPSSGFQAIVGRGVRGMVEGQVYHLGNERLGVELGLGPLPAEALGQLEREGKTAVLLMSRTEIPNILGVIAVADRVRAGAADTVATLRALGVRRIVMLTGDNEETAHAVARSVGVDEHRAGLLPEDKVRIVRDLESGGERVAFVGDGVNDAPALAAASVGVAMGAAGTDVALETADVALMADDLAKLPLAIRISRTTLGIVKQNIALSLAVKAVFVVLAVAGWATLWMAVAADMGASLAVIANGLRARFAGAQKLRAVSPKASGSG